MYDEPSITFEDYKEADKLHKSLSGLRDKCKNPGKHSEGTTVIFSHGRSQWALTGNTMNCGPIKMEWAWLIRANKLSLSANKEES